MTDLSLAPSPRGTVAGAVATAVVQVFRKHIGKGPTRARAYIHDDMIVCLLRGGFNGSESTLARFGREDVLRQSRDVLQSAMEADLRDAVERLTGRTVVAFMSATHVEPDLSLETFILAPCDDAGSAEADAGGCLPTLADPVTVVTG